MNYDGCCKTCKFWDTNWCDKDDSFMRYNGDESCSQYEAKTESVDENLCGNRSCKTTEEVIEGGEETKMYFIKYIEVDFDVSGRTINNVIEEAWIMALDLKAEKLSFHFNSHKITIEAENDTWQPV